MELIASIPLIGGFLATFLPFLVVLGIVVFIHEYGHYIVGRWCGIHAEVFSIGYGKRLYSWTDKRGTEWQIAALPLGGYVKFLGDMNAASFDDGSAMQGLSEAEKDRSFPAASVGRRALTVFAGPFFNFILSTVVFAGLFLWQGQALEQPTIEEFRVPLAERHTVKAGDIITMVDGAPIENYEDLYKAIEAGQGNADMELVVLREGSERRALSPYLLPPLVAGVQPLSPASDAGMREGDLILSLNGTALSSFEDLKDIVLASDGVELTMKILRDGAELDLPITPQVTETQSADGGFEERVMIGIAGALAFEPMAESPGLGNAVLGGIYRVGDVIMNSLNGLYHIITGALGADNLQGPIGIAQISGESATQGLENFIFLIGLISTAIGMLNLFPIPILDGGHLMIYAYEALTGRQPGEKFLNAAMTTGFVLLMALMVFATYNDLMRI